MKSLEKILAEATDEQAKRWLSAVVDKEWPKDMPIPFEAIEIVWHRLQKRVIAIKPKKKIYDEQE